MSFMREMHDEESEEDRQADQAVHHVHGETAVQRGDGFAELGGQEQRHEFVHEEEKQQ